MNNHNVTVCDKDDCVTNAIRRVLVIIRGTESGVKGRRVDCAGSWLGDDDSPGPVYRETLFQRADTSDLTATFIPRPVLAIIN